MHPEFSERQFEFNFNTEFVSKHRALLSTLPFLPTPRQEKNLGYDVRYDFEKGFKAKSLMLQFKVSHFVKDWSIKNDYIYNCYNGAYFRFSIRPRHLSKQHKIMLELSRKGESIFYCAPLFYRWPELVNFFRRQIVIDNSRFFDPIDIGVLPDDKQHHISYDPLGQFGFFHSKNKKPIKVLDIKKMLSPLESKDIDEKYLFDFETSLKKLIKEEYKEIIEIPKEFKDVSLYYQINYLLQTYIDITWFLIPLE